MNTAEDIMNLRNIRAFIEADKEAICLNRDDRVLNSAGGFENVPTTPLEPQDFRLGQLAGLVWDRSLVTTDEGRQSDTTYALIGYRDADVLAGDYFTTAQGDTWEVDHVSPKRTLRTECRLRHRGNG